MHSSSTQLQPIALQVIGLACVHHACTLTPGDVHFLVDSVFRALFADDNSTHTSCVHLNTQVVIECFNRATGSQLEWSIEQLTRYKASDLSQLATFHDAAATNAIRLLRSDSADDRLHACRIIWSVTCNLNNSSLTSSLLKAGILAGDTFRLLLQPSLECVARAKSIWLTLLRSINSLQKFKDIGSPMLLFTHFDCIVEGGKVAEHVSQLMRDYVVSELSAEERQRLVDMRFLPRVLDQLKFPLPKITAQKFSYQHGVSILQKMLSWKEVRASSETLRAACMTIEYAAANLPTSESARFMCIFASHMVSLIRNLSVDMIPTALNIVIRMMYNPLKATEVKAKLVAAGLLTAETFRPLFNTHISPEFREQAVDLLFEVSIVTVEQAMQIDLTFLPLLLDTFDCEYEANQKHGATSLLRMFNLLVQHATLFAQRKLLLTANLMPRLLCKLNLVDANSNGDASNENEYRHRISSGIIATLQCMLGWDQCQVLPHTLHPWCIQLIRSGHVSHIEAMITSPLPISFLTEVSEQIELARLLQSHVYDRKSVGSAAFIIRRQINQVNPAAVMNVLGVATPAWMTARMKELSDMRAWEIQVEENEALMDGADEGVEFEGDELEEEENENVLADGLPHEI